jgi:uncharacterized protein (TIGR03032 family)
VSQPVAPANANLPLEVYASRYFLDWMMSENLSLGLTTYQSSRLLLLGTHASRISGFERIFDRAMGLYATTDRLWLSSKYQIWQLDNVLTDDQRYNEFDKLYIPRIGYTTGDLDVHDLVVDQTGRIIFVSSLLNCLATVSAQNSCTPLWKPPFISKLVNEDRCHLNGLAMVDGQPAYVTACSRSDVVDGWRDRRRNGGCVIDLKTNEVILQGFSMPHSPRWYQNKLWLLNSGVGDFGYLDLKNGEFEPVVFAPGYLRGLAFWQHYAIVGLSKPRSNDKTFSGLELEDRLIEKQSDPFCGVLVIDLNIGSIAHWLKLEGVVTELYDVQVLPNVKRPMAIGFQTDEIARLLTLDPMMPLFGAIG